MFLASHIKCAARIQLFTFCKPRGLSTNTLNGNQTWKASGDPKRSFYHADLKIVRVPDKELRPKPKNIEKVPFGHEYSDHFVHIDWTKKDGWGRPHIEPLRDIALHPGSKVLHYATEIFEGMKAYRGTDGTIRLFRPLLNMARMKKGAYRAALPDFDAQELCKIITELVRLEREWVPNSSTSSLYLRPTLIGTDPALGVSEPQAAKLYVLCCPVGPYYCVGFKPISLLADSRYVRAFPGGVGSFKMGCNYAPTIAVFEREAAQHGCHQVLWLYGSDEQLTEAGTMNIFVLLKDKKGQLELVTPPLDSGLILPGITRQSLLELVRDWKECAVSERPITMNEVIEALKENRLLQVFGAGTAAVVSPVGEIVHRRGTDFERIPIPTLEATPNLMQKLYDTICAIQYGVKTYKDWVLCV